MRGLRELFERHGGEMPEGGFSAEEVWEANRATRGEYALAVEAEREARRAMRSRDMGAAREAEAEALSASMVAAGVPERFLGVPADLRRVPAMARGRGLWLYGDKGTGKTHSAAAALKGWASSGRGARFAPCVAMLADLRDAMGEHRERQATAAYARTPLLVLDDLGKEAPSQWALAKLFEVVDARYSARLPTVVTSQQDPRAMAERLASRGDQETAAAIVSRLRGSCDLVRTGGSDRRASGDA